MYRRIRVDSGRIRDKLDPRARQSQAFGIFTCRSRGKRDKSRDDAAGPGLAVNQVDTGEDCVQRVERHTIVAPKGALISTSTADSMSL